MEENVIDLTKLVNVRPRGDGTSDAQCPFCAANGADLKGQNHLRIWSSGAFTCVVARGDKAHNAAILSIVGTKGTGEIAAFTPPDPKPVVEEIYPDECLKRLIRDFSYWRKRGLSDNTLEDFEGGIATSGKMKNRYVFPLRDRHGRIHGFTGRYIFPIKNDGFKIARWKHLGPSQAFVFNREKATAAIRKTGVVAIVEGPGCPLGLAEVGITEVLPSFGVTLSSQLLSYLIPLKPRKIVISYNNEPENRKATLSGNAAAKKTWYKLINFFNEETVLIDLPPQKDWMDSSIAERLAFKERLYA